MTPKIYTDIFSEVGKDYRDTLKVKIDPIYKVNYYDKTVINIIVN